MLLAHSGSKHTCCTANFFEYVVAAVTHVVNGKATYGSVGARRWDLRVHRLHQR